tara:strand:+ start:861 stop:2126 length:1266 start_codon:yes stop_codon:yes gene_type:complete
MAEINTRSPYFITKSNAILGSCDLKLWVYTGSPNTSLPSTTPTYTLRSTATLSNSVPTVTFEVAELIKDLIPAGFNGTYPPNETDPNLYGAVWVDYQIIQNFTDGTSTPSNVIGVKGYTGYGYFSQGANPQYVDPKCMQSNKTIVKPSNAPLRIAVKANKSDVLVNMTYKGNLVYEQVVKTATDSKDLIQMVTQGGANMSISNNGWDNYFSKIQSLSDSKPAFYTGSPAYNSLSNNEILFPVDRVEIMNNEDVSGSAAGVQVINVINESVCEYDPYKVTFYNKYGALQDFWFFKNSVLKMKSKKTNFKRNILQGNNYNTYSHQKTTMEVNAMESLRLNSGWVTEDQNVVIEEMLLSESLWISFPNKENYNSSFGWASTDNYKTLPVQLKTSSFTFKNSKTDGLINHSIDFEFANDKINNIR